MSIVRPICQPIVRPITRALTAGGGGGDALLSAILAQTPTILYDNNNLGTFWADTTATTPATVNGAVARQDDVSGNGFHRTQANLANRPVLRGTPTGANLASGASWTAGTDWSVAGNTATATLSSGTLTAAAVAATVGRYYRVTWTITRTEGSVTASFGGRSGTARSASGTFVGYFDNTTNTDPLVFTGTGFSGTVTLNTIELVDVSAGSVSAPYGLQYDGGDDFMQTASVDLTGTDEVTVCAGVRKLSDAASGCLLELSTITTNPGSFALFAPAAVNANVTFNTNGSALVQAIYTNAAVAAPVTLVATGIADISSDTALLRINGVQRANSAADQGTGNYGNYVLYFGRRGGTTLPLNGLDFGLSIFPAVKSGAGLTAIEAFHADRTGVVL